VKCGISAHNPTGLLNVLLVSRGTVFCFVPSTVTEGQLLSLLVLFLTVTFLYQFYILGV
jgi:hypothetical protein